MLFALYYVILTSWSIKEISGIYKASAYIYLQGFMSLLVSISKIKQELAYSSIEYRYRVLSIHCIYNISLCLSSLGHLAYIIIRPN